MHDFPLYLIPLLPLAGSALNLIVGRKLPRWLVSLIACGSVAGAFVVAAIAIAGPLWERFHAAHAAGGPTAALSNPVYSWIASGEFHVGLRFIMDPLAAVMVMVVTFVGFLIHVYSTGYMAHERRYSTYMGYLNLFTGAMLILVLGDSLPVMFIGWEGVGLCSYLLIGFWFDKEANATAGRKAFIVNRIGDFGFLLGIILLWSATPQHVVDFQELAASSSGLSTPILGMPLAFWAGLLLFIGATGKSAQIPLYVWLPDAMAGPTPVSALIHAATMVTAGVYMVARLSFLYLAAPQVMMIVAGIGAATAIFAAVIGFAQRDIKRVLAYSTVSQLGFMFVGVGSGAFSSGIFHLVTHAFFKAGLFLGAGSVMHAMSDKTDIMQMGGLRKKTPITHAAFLIYCLAIAGIPPFSGFFSKDEILAGAFAAHLPGWPDWYGKLLWGVLSVAALGTAFYMWRLYFLVFAGESRADPETQEHIHESPSSMTLPLVVLAIGAIALGLLGMPHVFHVPNFMAEWLALPVAEEASPGMTWTLMIIATAAGVVGIGIAYALYGNGPGERLARATAALNGLLTVVRNKFYVDEFYDLVIVRPFKFTAYALYNVVDRFIIDLVFVNGTGLIVQGAGRLARAWQNGDVQRYMLAMVVGGAAILWFATRSSADFTSNVESGTTVRFAAELGSGVEREAARPEWDFDGDGRPDSQAPEAVWDFHNPGRYHVRLTVTDVFGRTKRIEHTVDVGGSP